MITVDNVTVGYGTAGFIKAVDQVSLTINDNEILGIAGESGSGKSTLMRAVYGDFSTGLRILSGTVTGRFVDATSGQVIEAQSKNFAPLWWDQLSYIPQGSMSVLNPLMKIEQQVVDGLPARERKGGSHALRQRIAGFFSGFGLEETVLDAYPHQLSGGMRQRVLVAIAAFVNPRLILADEPTTALDVVVQKKILLMMVEIQRRQRNSLVLVSHDLGVHYQITDRLVIMYRGQIVEQGPTAEIFANPQHDYTKNLIASLPRLHGKRAVESMGVLA
ncbi:peptide ABC transporter ATPase [Devosia epidermidihirudinis]|uniref:Peptide ABC transporter ATPase n=1 Tax=Devosia epidermidihirudinis TaxID=1293439 RepID=A0A0F5QFG7_9HYPH|nr:ABC transporter ATP-binding protein [Devosia epidermidihirudinis]KKC38759.1 peptide ABC transporter ATPase [Devosia epidermidihirudinis]